MSRPSNQAFWAKMGSFNQSKKMSTFSIAALNSRSSPRGRHQKRRKLEKYSNRIKELTEEMEEMTLEQKGIKEGQRQAEHKLEAVEAECDELRRETALILQQRATTQLRLALMFQILQARQNKDFTKATQLAQALRS